MTLKIDIHTHILPKEIPNFKKKFGYGGFIQLDHHASCKAKMLLDDGKFFREVSSNCWDPEVRLQECDTHSVNVQVLSTVPVMFNYWTEPQHGLEIARYLNDHIASVVARHPKRFVGLGTLPLQSPELAITELERCMGPLKMAGVQIGSHIQSWNLSDPALFPFFAAAEQLGAAIFVHPWDMMGQDRMQKYWLPWLVGMPAEVSLAICSVLFGGILERLPNLRIAFAHGGGAFPGTLGRINHGYHARPDLCATDSRLEPKAYLKRFFVDSLVHDRATLEQLIQLMGSSQIALGSDYPFPLGEAQPGSLIESLAGLTQDTLADLTHRTALRWLNRKPEDYL